MKSRLICALFLVIALTANCTAPPATAVPQPSASAVEEPAVILTTGEWQPYTSETMENYGAFTEIVSAVFKEMGVPVKYVFYPWKRAEEEVKNGKAFATFPYIETEERLQEYDFSDPVFVSTGRFFYMPERQKNPVIYETLADLQAYRVGGVLGYWYEKPFAEAGLKTDYVSSDETNIQKLYLGRVDLAASEELVGWALIQKLYPQEANRFAVAEKALNEDPLRLLVSRSYPDSAALLQKFNAALKEVEAKGIIAQILLRYGIKR
ncbi:MAG: transporter substrate-binding domain-containing protein [Chloroflexi bacterium]|nr:transporter substrate-binding domain-containing protein [Chloroflexota bacterium]